MELISQLANTGLLGLLLAIALITIWFLYKELKDSYAKRIEDTKQVNDNILKPLNEVKDQIINQSTLLRQFLEKTKT